MNLDKQGKYLFVFFTLALMFLPAWALAQGYGGAAVRDVDKILPEKERAAVYNEILRWRLDNIIPART